MSESSEIHTPKNKFRCLGLRKSIQKSSLNKTPLSDVKISYKSLHLNDETAPSPSTPRLSQKITQSACTTNCLPYRLSLSSRVREKYKKKKLEFVTSQLEQPDVETLSKTSADITQEIENKKQILEKHKIHQEKVRELEGLIAIWTNAFKQSLEDLSSKIEPKMETEDLIARLGIPPEMIEYT